MWIQVRSFDGKKSLRVDSLSKLTKIEDLRKLLVDHFEAPVENQRLFYRGKQLVDGHTLYDYSVGLNDIIQLMVKAVQPIESSPQSDDEQKADSDKENKEPEVEEDVELNEADIKDSVYKVGDVIDARDMTMGAWFEAKITQVSKAPKEDNHKEAVVKQVLTESTLAPMATNTENNNKKDENENKLDSKKVDAPATNDGCAELTAYDKLFDIVKNDGFLYHILYEGYDEDDIVKLNCGDVRPRAKQNIKLSDVKIGDVVMANYNVEEPDTRGFWYDCVITGIQNTRTIKSLKATVYFGPDLTPLENCKLLFVDEIFACETPGTQFTAEDVKANPAVSPVKRTNKPDCDHCLDNPKKKCKHCACCVCAGKHDPDQQILCDECNKAYHLTCLDPPLSSLPEEDDWYCHDCKIDDSEIVKAGEKLKESKKKSKMASNSSTTNRDWGRGMACVGRQKTCTVVPTNHFGPIPGVEVGTMWKFRVQVSEAGVHRPHVAGIAGRENEGAYSIVLSGGYEDDTDNGETFLYTGSGGRDLSGNKRTAEQSCDQTLTRMNKALAKMCNAPVDVKNGATSKDWRSGKPVRVVRSCKLGKHSKFAPDEGNRYDGIYKVAVDRCLADLEAYKNGTQLFPTHLEQFEEHVATGSDGRCTFRSTGHVLVRTPTNLTGVKSTFTNSVIANIRSRFPQKDLVDAFFVLGMRGINMGSDEYAKEFGNQEVNLLATHFGEEKVVRYWPEKGKSGFIVWRYMLQRDDPTPAPWTSKGKKRIEELGLAIQYPDGYLEAQAEKERLKNEGGTPAGKGKKGKRKHNEDEESEEGEENCKKKIKAAKYQVESDILKLIKGDDGNKKVWEEALETTSEGRPKFLSKVEELFTCICCQDLVFKPVTTPCFHNICKSCLKRAFKAEVFSCPACRTELGKNYSMPINETLSDLLVKLFPGYDAGR